MLKNKFLKIQYFWHLYQCRYHESLLKCCLCEDLKTRLNIKVLYHHSKVIELFHKMNEVFE